MQCVNHTTQDQWHYGIGYGIAVGAEPDEW